MTVLLKECRDIQLHGGPVGNDIAAADISVEPNADKVISEVNIDFESKLIFFLNLDYICISIGYLISICLK